MASTLGPVGMGALGSGLGSFIQSGDIGEGIQTGLTSFLGGKLLGGLTGGSSAGGEKIATSYGGVNSPTALTKASFLQAANPATDYGGLFSSTGMQQAAAGAFAPGVMPAASIGSAMAGLSADERAAREASNKREASKTKAPMPNPMRITQNPTPFAGGGEGMFFQYQRPPRQDGSQPEYPYYYADGGIMSLQRMQEGGEAEADQMMAESGMNEKDVIVDAIEAIKGMSEQPEIVLALFVQKYGEEALRDLVGRVRSGELDDTVERFKDGDKGMVRGPGDGSGVDDMVPATLEGEQDVLLSDGEFVLREKTTDALEKAYGGGFLDVINRAEEEAPRKLQQMVG
jgi:hypothetical protein